MKALTLHPASSQSAANPANLDMSLDSKDRRTSSSNPDGAPLSGTSNGGI